MAQVTTRYGHSEEITDPNSDWVTHHLLEELRLEPFPEPDDEHTQVSVGNEHWAVTAQVSGLVTFDNLDLLEGTASDLPENMYLRDVPDEMLISIWQAVVHEDVQSLLSYPWRSFEDLPPYSRDFYRDGA